jgi:hypothetical protein
MAKNKQMKQSLLEIIVDSNEGTIVDSDEEIIKTELGYSDLFTEYAPSTYGGYQIEIRRICKKTNKNLPNGFYEKNTRQLAGMYWGMRNWYKNKENKEK